MHWEKIPLTIGGKNVLKEQIDSLDKDTPVRMVRARQKDGKEVFYYEKFVKEKDCDIRGCNNKATETVVMDRPTCFFNIGMCSYHYQDFYSEEGLDKPFNMKDNVCAQYKHN